MQQFTKLFEPGKIGNMVVKNKIIMASMEKNYCTRDGLITQRYIDYLIERARGGVGLMIVEEAYIDPLGKDKIYQLGIYDDSLIPSLKELTRAIHQYDTKIGLQLNFAGRETSSRYIQRQPVAPSPVACVPAGGEVPRELTLVEIKDLVRKFADAALRTKKAGFDTLLIHGAHGYLINAFLSPYSNKRSDEYGGSLKNRMKFPLEVTRAIREAVGDDYPILYRISGDEYIEGGLTLEETKIAAQKLEQAGVDLIDVSAGIYESGGWVACTMDVPPAPFLPLASAIKEGINIPVSTVNRIVGPQMAEEILEEEKADFVTIGRPLHADPEFPNKVREGRLDDICPCLYCSQGCMDILGTHRPIFCLLNTTVSHEREFKIRKAKHVKSVMIVGGGPAGMEVARVSALRGHDVTLCEKEGELGGQIRMASKVPRKDRIGLITQYLSNELKKAGAKVKLNSEITPKIVYEMAPDVLVVATGSSPFAPPTIPGIDKEHVYDVFELILGKAKVGKKVAVIGAGGNGCHATEFITEKGTSVVLIEPSSAIGKGLGPRSGWFLLRRIERNPKIQIRTNTTLEEIHDSCITVQKEGKWEEISNIDTVVLALGQLSNNKLAEVMKREQKIQEVYTVGDCVEPRTALEAIYQGACVGHRL